MYIESNKRRSIDKQVHSKGKRKRQVPSGPRRKKGLTTKRSLAKLRICGHKVTMSGLLAGFVRS